MSQSKSFTIETCNQGKVVSSVTKFKTDPWFGFETPNGKCVYCNHSMSDHMSEPMMVKKAHWSIRSPRHWAGLYFLSCGHCAKDLHTSQVMCYQASLAYIKSLKSDGWLL